MRNYLEEAFGAEIADEGYELTNFAIDTTMTRLKITLLYIFLFLVGLAFTGGSFIRLRSV